MSKAAVVCFVAAFLLCSCTVSVPMSADKKSTSPAVPQARERTLSNYTSTAWGCEFPLAATTTIEPIVRAGGDTGWDESQAERINEVLALALAVLESDPSAESPEYRAKLRTMRIQMASRADFGDLPGSVGMSTDYDRNGVLLEAKWITPDNPFRSVHVFIRVFDFCHEAEHLVVDKTRRRAGDLVAYARESCRRERRNYTDDIARGKVFAQYVRRFDADGSRRWVEEIEMLTAERVMALQYYTFMDAFIDLYEALRTTPQTVRLGDPILRRQVLPAESFESLIAQRSLPVMLANWPFVDFLIGEAMKVKSGDGPGAVARKELKLLIEKAEAHQALQSARTAR